MPNLERQASPRCLALLATVAITAATTAAQTSQQQVDANQPAPSATPEALPTFLLPVPGGTVRMGMTIEQLIDVICETLNPRKPELALKETDKISRGLAQTSSELGQEQRSVPTFLLGKWPVTNKEYAIFVKKMAAIGTKVKPPFHWWRYGREDDYNAKIPDINREFKADGKMGPIMFWERYGTELPYKLVDSRGQSIEDVPVVFVSYRDAVKFAGWLGMRLPTEEEWTRAARGDATNIWPWSGNEQVGDKYDDKVLELMQLKNARDQRIKPVGSVPFCTGPFGHVDMTGQVWELTSLDRFGPICGQRAFEQEWKRTQKNKIGQLLTPPLQKDAVIVVKGGSYLSGGDPVQLHIDSRTAIQSDDVLEGVGFRLAKSLKPGYDMLISLVTSDYNMDLFAVGRNEQAVDYDMQVGIERYVLDDSGFPAEYHAVSLAPVNWLSWEKNLTLKKLSEDSWNAPVLLGTLATTEPMLQPKLGAGLYSIAYREKGISKELENAIKAGYKEVQADLKRKERGIEKEPEAAGKDGEDLKKGDWRAVLARFGLTDKDLEPKGADKDINFIRLGDLVVPTDQDVFLFHDNKGNWAGVVKSAGLATGALGTPTVLFGTGKVDKVEHAKVEFDVRLPMLKDQKKGVEYKLDLLLEQGPPAAGETWRVPTNG
jgi:formylglycine-generating enzyme required for sulfatase activity